MKKNLLTIIGLASISNPSLSEEFYQRNINSDYQVQPEYRTLELRSYNRVELELSDDENPEHVMKPYQEGTTQILDDEQVEIEIDRARKTLESLKDQLDKPIAKKNKSIWL